MFPFRCDSQADLDGSEEEEYEIPGEEMGEEGEEEEDLDEYGLGEKERSAICAAFTLLDTDGDGILGPTKMEELVVALGREPVQENMDDIMRFATDEPCDEEIGMNFGGFYEYLAEQLVDTADENMLRNALEVLADTYKTEDSEPGFISMPELRHHLKHYGLKLTDDEIDYVWEEENYWMLNGKRIEIDYVVKKLLQLDYTI